MNTDTKTGPIHCTDLDSGPPHVLQPIVLVNLNVEVSQTKYVYMNTMCSSYVNAFFLSLGCQNIGRGRYTKLCVVVRRMLFSTDEISMKSYGMFILRSMYCTRMLIVYFVLRDLSLLSPFTFTFHTKTHLT